MSLHTVYGSSTGSGHVVSLQWRAPDVVLLESSPLLREVLWCETPEDQNVTYQTGGVEHIHGLLSAWAPHMSKTSSSSAQQSEDNSAQMRCTVTTTRQCFITKGCEQGYGAL